MFFICIAFFLSQFSFLSIRLLGLVWSVFYFSIFPYPWVAGGPICSISGPGKHGLLSESCPILLASKIVQWRRHADLHPPTLFEHRPFFKNVERRIHSTKLGQHLEHR